MATLNCPGLRHYRYVVIDGAGPASVRKPFGAHPPVGIPAAPAARSAAWSTPVWPPLMTLPIMARSPSAARPAAARSADTKDACWGRGNLKQLEKLESTDYRAASA